MRRLLVIALTGLLCSLHLHAEGERFDEAWRWIQFTTTSGLPSDRIIDLVETDDGLVWALTASGVAYYDGFRWNTPRECPWGDGQSVVSLKRYGADSVLVVVEGQVYVGNSVGFTKLPLIDASYELAVLPHRQLLLMRNSSPYLFSNGVLTPFLVSREHTEGKTIALRPSRSGSVWAHLADGLYRLEEQGWQRKFAFDTSMGVVVALAENAHGSGIVYLAYPIEQRGLWEWTNGSVPRRVPTERPDNVRMLDIGPDDEALALYQSGDIRIRIDGVWSELTLAGAMIQDINFVTFGKNLDVWFGTEHGLFLYKRSSSRWKFVRYPSPDLRNSINEILKTRDGNLWLATSDGLEVLHADGSIESVPQIGKTPLYVVTGLAEDRDGNVWISSGSSFYGAYRWDGRRWTHFDVAGREEGGAHFHKIRLDRQGGLWFLGIGKVSPAILRKEPGAYLYAAGKFHRWGKEEGLLDTRVHAFGEGSDGSLWFGTAGALSRWKPRVFDPDHPVIPVAREGTWTHWTMDQGLRDNRAFALAVDQENRVWFGDHSLTGVGLGMIDQSGAIRYFTSADGLVNDNIWDIRVGEDTAVWITTERGLSRFQHGRWSTYDTQSGLLHPMLWPVLPVGGTVYVGTQGRGLAILNLQESSTPEPRIELDPPGLQEKNVLLRWAAFAFWGELDPSNIPTRYRINGGQWSAWSVQHEVTLTGLEPGEYSYDVQARGLFGRYREEGAGGSFSVPEPLYLRPGFYIPTGFLLVAVAVLGVVLLVRRRRHAIALRRSEEKFRTVTETTASAIFMVDREKIIFANSAAQELTGYSLAELSAMRYLDLIHPESRPAVGKHELRAPDAEMASIRYETKILARRGEERWLDCIDGWIQLQGRWVRLIAAFDSTERRLAEEKLRSLASELSLTEERERRRMATYLHDVIGQTLAIIKMKIGRVQKQELHDDIRRSLTEVRELVDRSILNAQTLTFDLCPPILYELSFEAAVEWLTENVRDQHGIAISFHDDRQPKKLSQDIRILLFQAVRELLMNVVKHAEARHVDVTMGRLDGMIRIAIRDDGTGFDAGDKKVRRENGGFGLFNIRERLTHFGGEMVISSQVGRGTEVVVTVPLSMS